MCPVRPGGLGHVTGSDDCGFNVTVATCYAAVDAANCLEPASAPRVYINRLYAACILATHYTAHRLASVRRSRCALRCPKASISNGQSHTHLLTLYPLLTILETALQLPGMQDPRRLREDPVW